MEIENDLKLATSTPQDAAKNIDGAKFFDVKPEVFKEYKDELQPEIDVVFKPTKAPPVVSRYIAQSEEHAALAAPDIEKLSYVEKQFKYLKQQVGKIPSNEEKIAELGLKHVFNFDKVTE